MILILLDNIVIKITTMSPEMQEDVVNFAQEALVHCTSEQETANSIKNSMQKSYPST